jgi:hypothetical protein
MGELVREVDDLLLQLHDRLSIKEIPFTFGFKHH